jgi:small-conductance mechanosensitive channel
VVIDGVEGKVLDIDWRATHLLTSAGTLAVVPNSVAAKAKIVNLSRPSNLHGVSISIKVPNHIRPRRVLDALDRTLQGSSSLLLNPPPKAVLKEAGERCPSTSPAVSSPSWARKAKCAINCSTSPIGISKRQVFPGIPMA